jgi:hypothetical protein
MKTMKTTILILTTLFAFNASLIFAYNPKHNAMKAELAKIEITVDPGKLLPAMTILVAFSDGTEHTAIADAMVFILAPVTPKVADFEDYNFLTPVDVQKLAPETPKESDFEDANFLNPVIPGMLAPTTPAEADFVI